MTNKKSICLCAIIKNEAPYIYEWVAFHLLAGITNFYVFNNESDDATKEILDSLSKYSWFKSEYWTVPPNISPQISAYNHFLKVHSNRYDYVANIDIDEFIFINNSSDIGDILQGFDGSVGALAINQRIVGSNGLKAYDDRLVLERFCLGSEVSYVENYFYKTIYRPTFVEEITGPHTVRLKKGKYVHLDGDLVIDVDHPGQAAKISSTIGLLHHYILKSQEEFEKKRSRGGAASSAESDRLARYSNEFFTERDRNVNTSDISLSDSKLNELKSLMAELRQDF